MEIKDRIIEGAAELFKTYGIKSVTMDSLASHLGMSKRTIYEVFSDKDGLLMGVLAWMAEKQRELVTRILDESENSIVAIFRLLEINRDHFQDMSPIFMADLKKYHHDVLMKKTDKCEMPDYRNNKEVIERGIKERLFRSDINADLVNRCLFSLGKSIMDQDLYPYEEFSRKEVISNIFINYLKGVSTPEGVELINELEAKF
ncbi:MAG TPA: TetR/AcrR family transcriptional regulator [Bacteroidales bacterium]|nr:TetR/AcrR family transcriptional regulator [Bacteroidales bacterium]